jgi:ABC-2 type transport system permease protein
MRNTWALYKKELRSYFVSPLFYIVSAVFLCLGGLFFQSDLIYFVQFGFGVNILENFFQLLFVDLTRVMLVTVPLLTMRLFAEERKLGTIELLYTYPLRDGEIFAGKFLACATVFLIMLGATALYPVYLYSIQPYDWVAVLAGYLGLVLLGVFFITVGLLVSSMTESQVVAGVLSVGLLFLFWSMSWNEAAGRQDVMQIVKALSTFDHFINFAKGIIDSGDVVYYVAFATFFGVLTLRSMESRRWRGRR